MQAKSYESALTRVAQPRRTPRHGRSAVWTQAWAYGDGRNEHWQLSIQTPRDVHNAGACRRGRRMPRGGLRMRSAAMVSEGGGLLSVTGISCPFRAVSLSPTHRPHPLSYETRYTTTNWNASTWSLEPLHEPSAPKHEQKQTAQKRRGGASCAPRAQRGLDGTSARLRSGSCHHGCLLRLSGGNALLHDPHQALFRTDGGSHSRGRPIALCCARSRSSLVLEVSSNGSELRVSACSAADEIVDGDVWAAGCGRRTKRGGSESGGGWPCSPAPSCMSGGVAISSLSDE